MCVSAGIFLLLNQIRYEHPYHTDKQYILYASCFQLVKYLHPSMFAFAFVKLQTKYIFLTVGVIA